MTKLRKVEKGETFGLWTALGESKHNGRILYDKCRCQCGTIKFVHHDHLIHGRTTNCGCKMYDVRSANGKKNKKHGMEGTIPYIKFMNAKARCKDKNNSSYYRYGGRGIEMKRKDFEGFWKDMGPSYYEHVKLYGEKNTTLDRINVDGNYCKDNCRRATREQQYNNMSTNHKVIYNGVEYNSISMLCKVTNKKYELVRDRIRAGWSVEDAVEKDLKITKKECHIKQSTVATTAYPVQGAEQTLTRTNNC